MNSRKMLEVISGIKSLYEKESDPNKLKDRLREIVPYLKNPGLAYQSDLYAQALDIYNALRIELPQGEIPDIPPIRVRVIPI